MAYTKSLIWVSIFMVVSMEVLVIPFAQSSVTRFFGKTTVYQETSTSTSSTKGTQTKLLVKRFRKAVPARVMDYSSSARAVPTGPDPLHHNNKPTWP